MTADAVTGVVLDAGFLSDLATDRRIEHEVLTDRWSWHAVSVNVPQTELVLAEREKPGRARTALELLLARCGPSVLIRPLDLTAVEAAGTMMRRYALDDIALAHTAAVAVPSGWTVFTTAPERYRPLGDAVDVFGLT
ncbi:MULTISPECIES: PIN domain-containing protein [Streptomyces]|uniref:hypothetical protein n=1 Tax=Streptomyces TaxID=1883 RepID=UPI00163D0E73|nr:MULTISPECIES: hypothetical protein [Streptomyces]MBC2878998.1 hypothetical protein [Streptomyces sp. TYQ1024]UBI40652.1 hypothetical protein K7I03_32115 [Streptomyces mobaraensis]UKW33235.1 hypothetical protein MCU78_32040 [Streptomyces sp. TYQ1024]